MSSPASTIPLSGIKPSRIPPLRPGDCLSRDEFERRYDATPDLKFAELIEGKVYVPPPISYSGHGYPHSAVIACFANYCAATPGVRPGSPSSLRMDLKNMPEPDAFMFILPQHGGQARISDDGYLVGAPELIAEISYTTASFDLHDKFQVYLRNGVREYIVVRTFDGEVDYFILHGSEFVRQAPDSQGIFRSEVFPGLWLDAKHLLEGNLAAVLNTVQQGIASAEHSEFVKKLQSVQPK